MTNSEQREHAEAAFSHLQHAAQEMVAAAHDTLALFEQVVSSAQLGDILDGFGHLGHLGQSIFKWPRPSGEPRPPTQPSHVDSTSKEATADAAPPDLVTPDAGRRRPHQHSPVERISVR